MANGISVNMRYAGGVGLVPGLLPFTKGNEVMAAKCLLVPPKMNNMWADLLPRDPAEIMRSTISPRKSTDG